MVKRGGEGPLKLTVLNHVSLLCKSLNESVNFYENVLGFVAIKRPQSFDFDGAWLFNYGVGIHLLQCTNPHDLPKKSEINPMDRHISFQCESMEAVERRLEEMKIEYVKRRVEEGGIYVDQIFIHDPDGFMIEICNCENLPVVPLTSLCAASSNACLRVPSAVKQCDSNEVEREISMLNFGGHSERQEELAMCR